MITLSTLAIRVALLLILLLPIGAQADTQDVDLPDLGSASEQALTPKMERILGRMVLRRVSRYTIDDVEVRQSLLQLGNRLAKSSHRAPGDFAFVPIDDTRINAFAAPGGVVGINTGIFLHSTGVHETAAVIAHEIAHVTQKHLARAYDNSSILTLQSAVALIGAILLANYDPQLAQAAATIGTASSLQSQINFTRANEQEADRIGMQILARAGYDPTGMPGFFGKLLRATLYSRSELPEFLRTHPLTENRLAEATSLASQYPRAAYPVDVDFLLTKTRLQTRDMNAMQAARHFEQELASAEAKENVEPSKIAPLRYGYLLALTQLRRYDEAGLQLEQLLATDGMRLAYLLAAARLQLELGRLDAAEDWFRKAKKLHPDHPAPVLEHARGLIRFQHYNEARTLLREYGRFHTDLDIAYYELSARAEAEAGFPGSSVLALAQASYMRGHTSKAVEQLEAALRNTANMSSYDRQRLQVRLAEFKYQLEIEKKLRL